MEDLIKQTTRKNEDRRYPSQKSQSFTPEKKMKMQGWFKKQYSSNSSSASKPIMNDEIESVAAVAAAAFAVRSINESNIPIRIKSDAGESTSKRISEIQETKVPIRSSSIDDKKLQTKPSIKKTPTFAEKPSNIIKLESNKTVPKSKEIAISTNKPDQRQQLSTNERMLGETEIDAWERHKMEKINRRLAKLNADILSWETKKKTKAEQKLIKYEEKVQQRKLRSLNDYTCEVDTIEHIAEGARAKAEDMARNNKSKVQEKANKARMRGKLPTTCFCC